MSFHIRKPFVESMTSHWAKYGVAALTLGAVFSANATDTVYDSLTGATSHVAVTSSGALANNYAFQCFTACVDPVSGNTSEPITSLGDYISLAPNTGRSVTGMNIGFVQGSGSSAFSFQVQVSIFSSPTTLQVTQTSGMIDLSAVPASTTDTGAATIVPVGLGPFNLPDTFYYTLAIVPSVGSSVPSNFGIWLWDYYQDGTPEMIPVGTDIGNTGSTADFTFATQVWGTVAGSTTLTTDLGTVNKEGLSDGYTPAVTFFTETPVIAAIPEPETYALMLGGLIALGAISRKRRKL